MASSESSHQRLPDPLPISSAIPSLPIDYNLLRVHVQSGEQSLNNAATPLSSQLTLLDPPAPPSIPSPQRCEEESVSANNVHSQLVEQPLDDVMTMPESPPPHANPNDLDVRQLSSEIISSTESDPSLAHSDLAVQSFVESIVDGGMEEHTALELFDQLSAEQAASCRGLKRQRPSTPLEEVDDIVEQPPSSSRKLSRNSSAHLEVLQLKRNIKLAEVEKERAKTETMMAEVEKERAKAETRKVELEIERVKLQQLLEHNRTSV